MQWAEEKKLNMVPCSEQAVQLAHTFIISLIQIKKIACTGEVLHGDTEGKFTCSTNFPNFTMAVSEVSFILRLEADLMQLWTLQNVCVHVAGSDISKFFLLSLNIVTLDFPIWCLVWNNCSLAGILWVLDACWLQLKRWKPLERNRPTVP